MSLLLIAVLRVAQSFWNRRCGFNTHLQQLAQMSDSWQTLHVFEFALGKLPLTISGSSRQASKPQTLMRSEAKRQSRVCGEDGLRFAAVLA